MRKIILIISGITLLLLICGIWAYLFIFGAPQSVSGVFTNFGIRGENETPFEQVQQTFQNEETGQPVVASTILRQLTTKPVAEMMFLDESAARYVEQGTGHIFDVALQGGTEIQVSNTTFTRVREAVFAPDGSKVVLTYEEGGFKRNTLGTIENGGITTTTLVSGGYDFAFSPDGKTLRYVIETQNGTEAYAYDTETKTSTLIFTTPFGSLRAHFGDKTYVYTKPAASLLGYVYDITSGALNPITNGRFGLMATPFEEGIVVTETAASGELQSTAYTEGTAIPVALPLFPEKCVTASNTLGDLVCGGMLDAVQGEYPDDWYKGVVTMNDLLWSVDIAAEEAVLIADPLTETGRVLDVEKIVANQAGDQFLIMNKTNSTLWILTP